MGTAFCGSGVSPRFSAASAWEIEIKRALGKLDAPAGLASAIERSGLEPLPMSIDHGIAAGRLPPHHSDPFDRMLPNRWC